MKILVILSGALLGIITNWIRVLGLIYIGYWSEMKSPLMNEHDNYGFLLFFIVISSVIFLVNWLSKKYSLPLKPSLKENNSYISNRVSVSGIGLKLLVTFSIILATSYISNQNLKSLLVTKVENSSGNASTYNVLANFGDFTEYSSDYFIDKKKCTLISRSYNFTTPGENVLPYRNIHNQDNFQELRTSSTSLNYLSSNIDVKHIKLRDKSTRRQSELLYWYEYNGYHTSNKYIAKLFEISYLLQTQSKMKLNAVWCSK